MPGILQHAGAGADGPVAVDIHNIQIFIVQIFQIGVEILVHHGYQLFGVGHHIGLELVALSRKTAAPHALVGAGHGDKVHIVNAQGRLPQYGLLPKPEDILYGEICGHVLCEHTRQIQDGGGLCYLCQQLLHNGFEQKLGPGALTNILAGLPNLRDENLLVGYDSSDDACVYQISDELAVIETVDFFTPIVDDPYTFGQIAATNALSDVYAMGGEVKTALNLVCFPEDMDLNVLGEILRGGAEKVAEAGGSLAGGHSIADSGVKYGLSVTGLVDPHRMYTNDTGIPGDKLVLTKALGVGLLCTANRVGEAAPEEMEAAIRSMTTLNKTAAEISRKYRVHAATDVTGFSFLGHLHEMMGGKLSCVIHANAVPVLPGAEKAADAFLYTAAGQRNRNHTGPFVRFKNVSFAMEEVLFDPQTSGGLLFAVDPADAATLEQELRAAGLPASIVGEILPKQEIEITVTDK